MPYTNFVARRCTPSINLLSLTKWGLHAGVQNSKCGLTKLLYNNCQKKYYSVYEIKSESAFLNTGRPTRNFKMLKIRFHSLFMLTKVSKLVFYIYLFTNLFILTEKHCIGWFKSVVTLVAVYIFKTRFSVSEMTYNVSSGISNLRPTIQYRLYVQAQVVWQSE